MAREILRFGQLGWITRADGVCWVVKLNNDKTAIESRNKVVGGLFNTPTCSTAMVNAAAQRKLGGFSDDFPGWTVFNVIKRDENGYSKEVVLIDKHYSQKYWRAYKTTGFGWKATYLGGILELGNYMADVAAGKSTDKYGPKQEEQPATAPFFENISPVLVLGIALVLIGIIIASK